MKVFSVAYLLTSFLGLLSRIFRKIKKTIKSTYTKFLFLSKGFSFKDYKEIDRKKLIDFINANRLAGNSLDASNFGHYLKKLSVFSQPYFAVILRRAEIAGLVILKGTPENSFVIHTFFLGGELNTKVAARHIFSHLLKEAKDKKRAELNVWIRLDPAQAPERSNFSDAQAALEYFYNQGFRWGYEITNMVLERNDFNPVDSVMLHKLLGEKGITVRNYNENDRDKLLEMIKSEFPWWQNQIRLILSQRGLTAQIMVAEHEKDIIAVRCFFMACDESFKPLKKTWFLNYTDGHKLSDIGCLIMLGVKRKWRGQGVGSILTCAAIKTLISRGASRIFVGTIVPGFFERFGFSALARYAILAKGAS